jgi:cell division protease FtsH
MSDNNKDGQGGSNPWMKSLLIWAGILLGLVLFVQMIDGGRTAAADRMTYSDFLNKVEQGQVKSVIVGKDSIRGRLANDSQFQTDTTLGFDTELVNRLRANNVTFTAQADQPTSIWMLLLYQSLPFLLILGVAFFVMRQMQKNAAPARWASAARRPNCSPRSMAASPLTMSPASTRRARNCRRLSSS